MRKRAFRFVVTLAVLFLSSTLLACQLGQLRVLIPDFLTSGVAGVQLYRVDDATGQLVDAGYIQFDGIEVHEDRGEEMKFSQYNADGSFALGPVYAPVIRDPAMPASIELGLSFLNQLPSGWFKIASYNLVGTSRPSTAQTFVAGRDV